MKIARQLLVFQLLLITISGTAYADNKPTPYYLSAHGGTGWVSDYDRSVNNGARVAVVELDTPYAITAAFGRVLNRWLRVESELGFIEAKTDEVVNSLGKDTIETGRDSFFNIMINVIGELPTDSVFRPFIGAGIGAVHAKHDINFDPIVKDTIPAVDSNDSEWVLGYQVMAGIKYHYTAKLGFELQYRYFGIGSRDHTQKSPVAQDVELDSTHLHLIMLGVSYSF